MIIRKANLTDVIDIYKWRIDPLSQSMFFNNSRVLMMEHKKWFQKTLIDPNKKIYIGLFGKNKVGVTRFDFDKKNARSEVSINLNPSMRGKNLSFNLLSKSILLYLKRNKKAQLIAKVKKQNFASLKIFKKSGFLKKEDNPSFELLIFNKNIDI